MQRTLHIKNGTARLVHAHDIYSAERALGMPEFEWQAEPGEEIIQVKTRAEAIKLLDRRGISQFSEIRFRKCATLDGGK
jgi:hypothetical protein